VQLAGGSAGDVADGIIQAAPPAQEAGGQFPEQGLVGAGELGMSRQGLGNQVVQEGAGRGAGGILALPGADDLQGQATGIGGRRVGWLVWFGRIQEWTSSQSQRPGAALCTAVTMEKIRTGRGAPVKPTSAAPPANGQ
jgi:hypothetical protein